MSGDKVYFNRNFHIEPTNRCVFNCRFCSYRRPAGSPEAWDYTMEEIEQIAAAGRAKASPRSISWAAYTPTTDWNTIST